eukprot:gb/GECH01001272.1/.p1 GENE.gb/GECH01001272.1/~~gb/GECH01001272.1/.p1  ORF type:complete len:760 (+),score=98.22 gb/GECH01001272.1/:1-2280(+)
MSSENKPLKVSQMGKKRKRELENNASPIASKQRRKGLEQTSNDFNPNTTIRQPLAPMNHFNIVRGPPSPSASSKPKKKYHITIKNNTTSLHEVNSSELKSQTSSSESPLSTPEDSDGGEFSSPVINSTPKPSIRNISSSPSPSPSTSLSSLKDLSLNGRAKQKFSFSSRQSTHSTSGGISPDRSGTLRLQSESDGSNSRMWNMCSRVESECLDLDLDSFKKNYTIHQPTKGLSSPRKYFAFLHGVLHRILGFLDPFERIKLRKVSRGWNVAATDPFLYHTLDLSSISRRLFDSNFSAIVSLPYFSRLKTLDLSNCWCITDEGITSTGQLKELQSISLNRCYSITDFGLCSILDQCPKLEQLDLSHLFQISDQTFNHIQVRPDLKSRIKSLKLKENPKITDRSIPLIFGELVSLEELEIGKNVQFSDHGFVSLLRRPGRSICTTLEKLSVELPSLGNNGVINLFRCFSRANRLEFLSLAHMPYVNESVIDVLVSTLGDSLHNVELLGLRSLTDNALQNLSTSCSQINSIKLESCIRIGSMGIIPLVENITNLEELSLCYSEITDEAISAIGRHGSSLRKLSLSGCSRLTDDGIISLSRCQNLKDIDLSGIRCITDTSVIKLAQHCNLTRVLLSQCSLLSDRAVRNLAAYSPQLTELNLEGLTKITDSSLQYISQYCPRLRGLALRSNKVTDQGLCYLASGCPLLRELKVCELEIADNGLQAVINRGLLKLEIAFCHQVSRCVLEKNVVQRCSAVSNLRQI